MKFKVENYLCGVTIGVFEEDTISGLHDAIARHVGRRNWLDLCQFMGIAHLADLGLRFEEVK